MAEKKRIIEQLKLDGLWDNLSPGGKRIAIVVGVLSTIFLALSMMTGEEGEKKKTSTRESVKRSVLTDVNTREYGIDALSARVKAMESENDTYRSELERVQSQLKEVQQRRGNDPDVSKQVEILGSQLKGLTDEARTLGWAVEDIKENNFKSNDRRNTQADTEKPQKDRAPSTSPLATVSPMPERSTVAPAPADNPDTPANYFRTPPVKAVQPGPARNPRGGDSASPQSSPAVKIFVTESMAQDGDADGSQAHKVYLPSGSILSGVLLNGMDAATGRNARNEPFPVLIRIQKEAILPNEFTADVKECFVTLAGYGELSSERAYLRGETLSCVTNDGDVIDESFPSYAVGEDGKAGIRGRLVSKAGSLIAKTALAGFAAGIAEAFNTSPVPVIQTSDVTSDKTYQDNFSKGAMQHGASTGASQAMTRLADYYMDMADQIYPVIEIDAGRQVDMVLTSGFQLNIRKPGAVTQPKDSKKATYSNRANGNTKQT